MELVQISYIKEPLPITVFHIKDNLNMGNFSELVSKAQEAYDSGARNLVLDLAETRFISSAGISGMIQIFQLFNQNTLSSEDVTEKPGEQYVHLNEHLRLCNCSPSIVNVLTIAGLVEVLGVFDSLQEALASF